MEVGYDGAIPRSPLHTDRHWQWKPGHNLGPDYDSATLRRIFGWLRKPKGLPDFDAGGLAVRLSQTFEVTIVTTNWDTHVEWILDAEGIPFNYGVGEATPDRKPVEKEGDISLLKLHGSVNMSYCDCCQQWTRLYCGSPQPAIDMELLLDPCDFRLHGADTAICRPSQRRLAREAGRMLGLWCSVGRCPS